MRLVFPPPMDLQNHLKAFAIVPPWRHKSPGQLQFFMIHKERFFYYVLGAGIILWGCVPLGFQVSIQLFGEIQDACVIPHQGVLARCQDTKRLHNNISALWNWFYWIWMQFFLKDIPWRFDGGNRGYCFICLNYAEVRFEAIFCVMKPLSKPLCPHDGARVMLKEATSIRTKLIKSGKKNSVLIHSHAFL